MELRSYNVESVYNECVKCRIGEELGVRQEIYANEGNIASMLSQIDTKGGRVPLNMANIRKDGEVWTPYLQIVEMLVLMGKKLGLVSYRGELTETTIIKIKDYGEDESEYDEPEDGD